MGGRSCLLFWVLVPQLAEGQVDNQAEAGVVSRSSHSRLGRITIVQNTTHEISCASRTVPVNFTPGQAAA
jgi:hypothetical protein